MWVSVECDNLSGEAAQKVVIAMIDFIKTVRCYHFLKRTQRRFGKRVCTGCPGWELCKKCRFRAKYIRSDFPMLL